VTTWTCRDADVTCARCDQQILPGTEMISTDANKFTPGSWMHPSCFAEEHSRSGRETPADCLNVILPQLTAAGTMRITAGQLRVLLDFLTAICPDLVPVRRPDAGKPGELYRKMPGWLRTHVTGPGQMSPQEWAGFWLDHLDVGRCPIVRRDALTGVLSFVEYSSGEHLIWQFRSGQRITPDWTPERVSELIQRQAARHGAGCVRS
jgi:hypothetical protein